MIRAGALAAAIAASMTDVRLVEKPRIIEHAKLEQRLDGQAFREATRGVAGAGHQRAPERPIPQPCTYRRKPGKRALRRARGRGKSPC